MYASFYGMTEKPFQISTDPRFLWLGEKHREALANLKYGLLDRNGFVVLTGDVGTGKTTLVNALIDVLDDSVRVAKINHPSLDTNQFLSLIAKILDPNIRSIQKSDLLIFFNTYLQQAYDEGLTVLLIIDEAHRLTAEVLEEIRLLSNIELAGQKLLSIFFVGQDEIKPMLQTPECRALRQRITSFYHIEVLEPEEMRQYVEYRMKVSGMSDPLFTTEALQLIHVFSGGNPRVINNLCDRALLTGYVKEQRVIDADIIMECANELELNAGETPIGEQGKRLEILSTGRSAAAKLTAGTSSAWQMLRSSLVRIGAGCSQMISSGASTTKVRFTTFGSSAGRLLRRHRRRILPAALVSVIAVLFFVATLGSFSGMTDVQTAPPTKQADETNPMAKVETETATRAPDVINPSLPSEENAAAVSTLPTLPVTPAVKEPTFVDRAAAALAQKDYMRAIELLEANPVGAAAEDTENDGLYARALVGRANELMTASPHEAETLLLKATEVAPMMVEPYIMLGKRYTRQKAYPKAIDAYQKAVELDPTVSDAFFNLGFIYAATGQFEEAEEAFKQVVVLKPDYVDKSLFNLAVVQQKLGKKAQSIANLEEAVAMRPENERALAYLNQLRRSATDKDTEQIR